MKRKTESQASRIRSGLVLYDNIVVKPIVETQSGEVYKPQNYEDKPEIGEVVAMGEGRIFDNGTIIPLKVKLGDKVLFQKYSAVKVRENGEDLLLIREEDVYVVFK